MRHAFIFSLLLLLSGCASTRPCELASDSVSRVAKVRNLSPTGPVACQIQSESQIADKLNKSIQTRNTPARLQYEGAVYELLGVLPIGYPYLNSIVGASAKRTAGFYDVDERSLFVAADIRGEERRTVLEHELTHLIQDQHFSLNAFLPQTLSNDELLTRNSVMEGDAMLVSEALAGGQICAPSRAPEAWADLKAQLAMSGDAKGGLPTIIRAQFSFPYIYGPRFLCELRQTRGASAIDYAFKLPPASTHEILFPQKYIQCLGRPAETCPRLPQLSDIEVLPDSAFNDTLGAFISAFLATDERAQFEELAEAWRGDRISYSEGQFRELLWTTVWRDSKYARRYYEYLILHFEHALNSKREQISSDSTAIQGQGLSVVISRSEERVRVQSRAHR